LLGEAVTAVAAISRAQHRALQEQPHERNAQGSALRRASDRYPCCCCCCCCAGAHRDTALPLTSEPYFRLMLRTVGTCAAAAAAAAYVHVAQGCTRPYVQACAGYGMHGLDAAWHVSRACRCISWRTK
jgi:hypothetical protein